MAVINIGDSTVPLLLAIVVPALFAALLGYFMFYGRLSDVYMGVITLTVTLILFNLVNSTAGPEWRIGTARARRLQRHSRHSAAELPGRPDSAARRRADMFYLASGLAARSSTSACGCCSPAGSAGSSSAIRENERRAELLGYDARAYKLAIFAHRRRARGPRRLPVRQLGAFVSPTIFGLAQSAQIIIWVIVGGLGTLIGPIVGCIAIQWLTTESAPTS